MSVHRVARSGMILAGLGLALAAGLPAGDAAHAAEPLPIETPVEEMPPQMARAYIIDLQEELAAHGYTPGQVDGVLGSRTRQAIRQYQKDAGLLVNGVASKELLDHMKFALPKVYAKKATPSSGPSRELVREVQTGLATRGYYASEIDGLIGPATREAVRRFQADAGLPVTGTVDRRLAGELKSIDPGIRASDYVNSI
ncbi:MAG: peptidoglycan-binding protein [Alphaproteobacteria bacterium]